MGEILFLAHRVPYPPDRGDRMRSFHLLRLLSGLAPLHLACFVEEEAAVAPELDALVASAALVRRRRSTVAAGLSALAEGRAVSLTAFDAPAMHAHVRRLLAERPIDRIFAFSGQMAQFVPADFTGRFVMDFVDVDSAKFAAYAESAGWPMRLVHRREAERLGAFEAAVAARADASLFVSEAEAALFRRATGAARVGVLENGIDLAAYDPDVSYPLQPLASAHPALVDGRDGRPSLRQAQTERGRGPAERGRGQSEREDGKSPLVVFTGQMNYRPNVEAVCDFARRSWPAVRKRFPQARFAVVGRDPDAAVTTLAGDGVIVTGAVDDVRGWIAAADVVVAPLRIARGVQNKVLEAMALAKAVVASPAAFEGIAAEPGRDLIVADRDGEAEAVIALLAAPKRAAAIGRAARARIEAHYSWEARRGPLAEFMGYQPALGAAA